MPAKRKATSSASPSATTRRLALMNLALRGIKADFGSEHAATFCRDLSIHFPTPTRFLNAA